MSYARLSRRPLLFKSFTGLAVSEFDVIVKEIESKYDEHRNYAIGLFYTSLITQQVILLLYHIFSFIFPVVFSHTEIISEVIIISIDKS
jgi:hypothetical protein